MKKKNFLLLVLCVYTNALPMMAAGKASRPVIKLLRDVLSEDTSSSRDNSLIKTSVAAAMLVLCTMWGTRALIRLTRGHSVSTFFERIFFLDCDCKRDDKKK